MDFETSPSYFSHETETSFDLHGLPILDRLYTRSVDLTSP